METFWRQHVTHEYEVFDPATAGRLEEIREIHYMPKHDSWLNMAGIGLSVLSRQCMNDYFKNVNQLAERIKTWQYHLWL